MKKNVKILAGFLLLFCLVGCASLPERERFIVSLTSPHIELGEIELQFDTFLSLSGLKKEKISVLYYPQEDAVCLRFRYELVTYHQFWNRKGRQEFITALEKYNEDYDARELITNTRRSRRIYGLVEGYLIWQMYSFTTQARAQSYVDLGYMFKDRAPYFTIYQRQAEYMEGHSRDNYRTSAIVTKYFTRSQAAELAEFFKPEFLQNIVSSGNVVLPDEEAPPDRDEY